MPTAFNHHSLSIVSPVFNEETGIDRLVTEVRDAMAKRSAAWEFVVVNDGSHDNTLPHLIAWHARDPRIKVVSLSRNFGHQAALLAGLSCVTGDIVACIDGDLQDPPRLLTEMIDYLESSNVDVVYGVRRRRKEDLAKRSAYWLAYRVMQRILDIDLPLDSGDFAVMRKPVVEAMLRMPEQSLFLRGLRAWVGFTQHAFEYERAARFAGEAKYKWKDLFRLAYNGIFSFTKMPIRLLGGLGLAAIGLSATYSLYLIWAWLRGLPSPQGFTTLVVALMFFSGVQLVAIRILGSYIHRIYDEVRGRPLFIINRIWGDGLKGLPNQET